MLSVCLGALLLAMSSRRILSADVGHKGTQLKLTLVLEGNQSVVFKPQWYKPHTTLFT